LDLEAELRRILDAIEPARQHAAAHVRKVSRARLSASMKGGAVGRRDRVSIISP
jgi:hypothetical protein